MEDQNKHNNPSPRPKKNNDNKALIVILLLLFLYPVGVILMWFWTNWPKWLKFLLTLPFVLGIIGLIFGLIFLNFVASNDLHDENLPTTPEPVVCTLEAKLCPDGETYVSRQGPKCEFAECPTYEPVDAEVTPVEGELENTEDITEEPLPNSSPTETVQ